MHNLFSDPTIQWILLTGIIAYVAVLTFARARKVQLHSSTGKSSRLGEQIRQEYINKGLIRPACESMDHQTAI